MNKTEFIKAIRAIAQELKPLTVAAVSGAATWNGSEYVKGSEKSPNPYALAWWSTLIAVAELIESQESTLSSMQIAYLNRLLFGGMGSLNDLHFDPKEVGAIADLVNKRLDQCRHVLFSSFND